MMDPGPLSGLMEKQRCEKERKRKEEEEGEQGEEQRRQRDRPDSTIDQSEEDADAPDDQQD